MKGLAIRRLVALLVFASTAATAAPGDTERGKKIHRTCRACHSLEKNTTGPRHCGLVGRAAGSVPGFVYSPAMRSAGLTWTADNLDAFLAGPSEFVPGNFMPFGGLPDPQARADLIAYLATQDCKSP